MTLRHIRAHLKITPVDLKMSFIGESYRGILELCVNIISESIVQYSSEIEREQMGQQCSFNISISGSTCGRKWDRVGRLYFMSVLT